MATAAQLLSGASSQDRTLIIHSDLRTISIPRSISNLGVEFDDDVMRVEFQMPSEYCGISLAPFKIRINYLNANAEPDVYEVDDAVVRADDTIKFSWLVGRHAAMYKGDVRFNVCLRDLDGTTVKREFNTTIATLPILEGLETGEKAIVEYNDIFEQWRASLFGEAESAVNSINTAKETALAQISSARDSALADLPTDYTATVEAADEGVRTKADAIVQTVRGRNIRIDDSAADPLRGLRLFGASTQETTNGKNKVDLSSFEFSDSTTYNHRIDAQYSKDLRDLSQFLLANAGKSIIMSMTRSGQKSGVEIGTISLFDNADKLLCSILPNVPHTILELPTVANYAYIYGSTTGASVANIQIEFGTEATEYEPYTGGAPAPNPEYPMAITDIEASATRVLGKNLIPYPYSDTTKTVDGITFTDNGDGSITANGTATDNAVFYFTNVGTNHYVDGLVCLSGCPAGGSVSGTGYSIRLNTYVNGVETSGIVDTGSGKSAVFDNTLARIYFVVLKGGTVKNLTIRPMLEYGNTPTEYEPYVEPSIIRYSGAPNRSLRGLPVASGGNYIGVGGQQWLCDEVDYERGVYIQRVIYKTLDGSFQYQEAGAQVAGTYTAFVRFTDVWIEESDCFMADRFRCYPSAEYKTSSAEGVYTNFGNNANLDLIIVRLSNEHATDMTSFIDFMTEHPVKVLAPLKTPIETPLLPNGIAMLETFREARASYPVTSVFNRFGAFMEVSYNVDTKAYIDRSAVPVTPAISITDDGKGNVTITTTAGGS